MSLKEQDLEFTFENAKLEEIFDKDEIREKSNIKAVDFLVEYDDCYRFIEIKDIDCPNPNNPEAFVRKFKSGELIDSLARKYRDSKFYFIHTERPIKKFEYIVLISAKCIDDALLLNKQDQLKKKIPIMHNNWINNSVDVCAILSIKKWKSCFGQESIKRLSEQN